MVFRDVIRISAFVPEYCKSKGQGLRVYFRDGTVGWQDAALRTFISRLAALFTVNIREARRSYAHLVGRKNLIPLVLTPQIIFVPLKTRRPPFSGEPAYGYFRLRSVMELQIEPTVCTVLLEGGQRVLLSQSGRTLQQRLRAARRLEEYVNDILLQSMQADVPSLSVASTGKFTDLTWQQENGEPYGIVAEEKTEGVRSMELRNLMEMVVWQRLDEVLNDSKEQGCRCAQCKMDMAALALNDLPPRYVVTQRGETYSKADILEIQRYVDVVAAVVKAAKLVQKNPRHE